MKKETNAPITCLRRSRTGHVINPIDGEIVKKLVEELEPEQRRVTQRAGTEPPFCEGLLEEKRPGTFLCTVCSLPVFTSVAKFTSGTGWPSFSAPYDPEHVEEERDTSHGMDRSEVHCARCGAHFGHVFPDGPAPTHMRYCINSASLRFVPDGDPLPEAARPDSKDTGYFAGGCFWGIEHAFKQVPGVVDAQSGYQNGTTATPTYEEVCSGKTGHAESVRVVFNREEVSYGDLVRFFLLLHDPTTRNRQGLDVGSQYRSAIFTCSREQMEAAQAIIAELEEGGSFGGRSIVTEVEMAGPFYEAEPYHQDYMERTGRSCHVDIAGALKKMGWAPQKR